MKIEREGGREVMVVVLLLLLLLCRHVHAAASPFPTLATTCQRLSAPHTLRALCMLVRILQVFCHKCCKTKIKLPEFNYKEEVTVCDRAIAERHLAKSFKSLSANPLNWQVISRPPS